MKILHTSDWHLDHKLYENQRTDEHQFFLDWLRELIITEQVNLLVVAGDIFDNKNPTLRSQELYVGFIKGLIQDRFSGKSVCRHLVIVAGNHDSAGFLAMNRSLFRYLDIHVVGKKPDDWKDVVLELKNGEKTEAIVAAFPFISEVDLRELTPCFPSELVSVKSPAESTTESSSESLAEPKLTIQAAIKVRQRAALQAYKDNWQMLADLCGDCREQSENTPYIPIISTGHLFTKGEKTIDKGGVRDTYVGTLERFPGGEIPKQFDYVALGHLHVPQQVGQCEHHQYSGSPLPISFDEADQNKQVIMVEWDEQGTRTITSINIPTIRKLVQIKGDWTTIQTEIKNLLKSLQSLEKSSKRPHELKDESVWLEVQYTETERRNTLINDIADLLKDRHDVIWVRCSAPQVIAAGLTSRYQGESLTEMNPLEVFQRVLDAIPSIDETEHAEYIQTYLEAWELCKS